MAQINPEVSLIVVTWKMRDLLESMLTSVFAGTMFWDLFGFAVVIIGQRV